MSAAAIVQTRRGPVFVKRHDGRVRTASDLAAEHAFADHLRALAVPIPEVLRTASGAGTLTRPEGVYEVHRIAAGVDAYRDAPSWTPFASLAHARSAGAALARLHLAAAAYRAPARSRGVLRTSCELVTSVDPIATLGAELLRRPGLARALAGRAWEKDLLGDVVPFIGCVSSPLTRAPSLWAHNDWHPSNLTWSGADRRAGVAGVVDLGLANRTFAVHDLATALERSVVSWLDLPAGTADADHDAADAIVDGYLSVSPMNAAVALILPNLLPVVHVEYALSEVEYFSEIVGSPANAELAYEGFLLGHARWFAGARGAALVDHLRRRFRAMGFPSGRATDMLLHDF